MPEYGKCNLCKKGELEFLGKKVVADTKNNMLKCNKCHHEMARRVE